MVEKLHAVRKKLKEGGEDECDCDSGSFNCSYDDSHPIAGKESCAKT